jgi:hypothetical protein
LAGSEVLPDLPMDFQPSFHLKDQIKCFQSVQNLQAGNYKMEQCKWEGVKH